MEKQVSELVFEVVSVTSEKRPDGWTHIEFIAKDSEIDYVMSIPVMNSDNKNRETIRRHMCGKYRIELEKKENEFSPEVKIGDMF